VATAGDSMAGDSVAAFTALEEVFGAAAVMVSGGGVIPAGGIMTMLTAILTITIIRATPLMIILQALLMRRMGPHQPMHRLAG
jgi:hypothetical protein